MPHATAQIPPAAPSRPLWSPDLVAPAGEDPTLRPLLTLLAEEDPAPRRVLELVPQMSATTLLILLRLPPQEWQFIRAWLRANSIERDLTRQTWSSNPAETRQRAADLATKLQDELVPLWRAVLTRIATLEQHAPAVATPLLVAAYESPLLAMTPPREHPRSTEEEAQQQPISVSPLWPELADGQIRIAQGLETLLQPVLQQLAAQPRPWTPETEAAVRTLLRSHRRLGAHLVKRLAPLPPALLADLAIEPTPIPFSQISVQFSDALLSTYTPDRPELPALDPTDPSAWDSIDARTNPRRRAGEALAPVAAHWVARLWAPSRYHLREVFPHPQLTTPTFDSLDADTLDGPTRWATDPDYAPGGVARPADDLVGLLNAVCAPHADGTLPPIADDAAERVSEWMRQLLATDPVGAPSQYRDDLLRWLAPYRATLGPRGALRPADVYAKGDLHTPVRERHHLLVDTFAPWLQETTPDLRTVAIEVLLANPDRGAALPTTMDWATLLNEPSVAQVWRVQLWRRLTQVDPVAAHQALKRLTRPLPDAELLAWGERAGQRLTELSRHDEHKREGRAQREALALLTDPNLPLDTVRGLLENERWHLPEARRALSANPVATADPTARAVLRRMRDPVVLRNLLLALPRGDEGQQVLERLVKMNDAGVEQLEWLQRNHPDALVRHATREALRPLLMSSTPAHRLLAVKIVGQAGTTQDAPLPVASKRARRR